MKNRHLYILVSILTIISLSIFFYKIYYLRFPLSMKSEAKIWNLEAEISFKAKGGPVKLILNIPDKQSGFLILKENFITCRYGRKTSLSDQKRKSTWTIRNEEGEQLLYYRAIIAKDEKIKLPSPLKKPPLLKVDFDGIHKMAANTIIEEIKQKSADIESMITELLKKLEKTRNDENIAIFFGANVTNYNRTVIAVKLLNFAGIPARMVRGLKLDRGTKDASFITWLEIFDEGTWKSFNVETGDNEIPDDYFVWWRGLNPIIKLTGGEKLKLRISTTKSIISGLESVMTGDKKKINALLEFSVLNLPLRTQAVYRIMLQIPLGALLLVILRNVVGIKTFGTFMPILIAMAFRETNLWWGICLFSILISLGLSIRFYLSNLKLLLVPRLASLLTVVVLFMITISILSHKLGLAGGLSVALFPMIIITMTIERMSIVWEERGAYEAIKQGVGSMVVAIVAYPVFTSDNIEHIIFIFPELILIVLSCTLLLGRYTGYKLFEITRFRELTKEIKNGI